MLKFRLYHFLYILVTLEGFMATTLFPPDDERIIRYNELCNCENETHCISKTGGCSPNNCFTKTGGAKCQEFLLTDIVPIDSYSIPESLINGSRHQCGPPEWTGSLNDSFEVSGKFESKQFNFFGIYFIREKPKTIDVSVKLESPNGSTITQYPLDGILEMHTLSRQSWELRTPKHSLGTLMFSKFVISNLPKDLCTLEISIGRNLALTRSVSKQGQIKFGLSSSRAVDGKVRSCSMTAPPWDPKSKSNRDSQPWWKVMLSDPAFINVLVLFSHTSTKYRDTDTSISMEYTDPEGKVIQEWQGDNIRLPWEFHIVSPSTKPVKETQIWFRPSQWDTDEGSVAILCEVLLIGAFQCSENTTGPLCEHECNAGELTAYGEECKPCPLDCRTEKCSDTGQCLDGCVTGWRGDKCDSDCNYCLAGVCDQKENWCLSGCPPGYLGISCSEIRLDITLLVVLIIVAIAGIACALYMLRGMPTEEEVEQRKASEVEQRKASEEEARKASAPESRKKSSQHSKSSRISNRSRTSGDEENPEGGEDGDGNEASENPTIY